MNHKLEETVRELLKNVIKEKWKFPVYQILVTSDGSMVFSRHYHGTNGLVEYEMLTEHKANIKYKFPLTLILLDSDGKILTGTFEDNYSAFNIKLNWKTNIAIIKYYILIGINLRICFT